MEEGVKTLGICLLAVLLSSSAFARQALKIEILHDDGFNTTDYSKLILVDVSAKDYLADIQDDRHYDDIADQVHEINHRVRNLLTEYCNDEFQGGKGQRVLKMTLDLDDYHGGSTAAAMWVGFGAGSGSCTYEVHLWDEKKDVAAFKIRAGIQRWIDVSGDMGRARAPKVLLNEIRQFLDQH
jgi:hypothetical protein